MLEAGTLHFELDSRIRVQTGDTETSIPLTFVGDVQAPDRISGKLTVTLGFFALEMETVIIGDTSYITNIQTGEWEVSQSPAYALPSPTEFMGDAIAALGDRRAIGGGDARRNTGVSPAWRGTRGCLRHYGG